MSKNFFQDVVPPERRTIRNIPIMGGRRKKNMPPEELYRDEGETMEERPIEHREDYPLPVSVKPKSKFPGSKVLASIAIVLIGGFVFGMMTVFTSAKIDIIPKKETAVFNLSLSAKKNPAPGEDALRYEVIELVKEEQTEVPATGEE